LCPLFKRAVFVVAEPEQLLGGLGNGRLVVDYAGSLSLN